jgi:hypothetical protein
MVERLRDLDRLPPLQRIPEIEADLRKLPPPEKCTSAMTFHRKKLLRMHDWARLEAGLVTPEQLQEENSPVKKHDFSTASIVWRRRLRG